MKRSLRGLAIVAGLWAMPALAAFHLFRIDQVYSNADGSVQYVVMREVTGTNGENLWAGQMLTATDRFGAMKQISFPTHLSSSATASRSVLIATEGFAAAGGVTPDYTIPVRFLPTDGGTLDYASGTDRITLPALPTDGVTAINRNGAAVPAVARNFANQTANVPATAVTSIEFYSAVLDHYFISALAPDINALDSGRIAGWARTGQSFGVYPSQAAGGGTATPVCRIIIPPPYGDSHFFGRSAKECADTLAKFPFFSQETAAAFYVTLPTAGTCPAGTVPVYRAFSNRSDANHRYMTDRTVRDQMVARGWAAEGDGPDLVVMCAPPAPTAAPAPAPEPPPSFGPPGGYDYYY